LVFLVDRTGAPARTETDEVAMNVNPPSTSV